MSLPHPHAGARHRGRAGPIEDLLKDHLVFQEGCKVLDQCEEALLLVPFAVWHGLHPAGPLVVFNGKSTAYVISESNPSRDEILRSVEEHLLTSPLKARIN